MRSAFNKIQNGFMFKENIEYEAVFMFDKQLCGNV